jgi:glycine/D-amino acid oxidase-like deaminating enzyme
LGITTSLATAKLLASAIVGDKTEIDGAPYLPSRYPSSLGDPARGAELAVPVHPHA